MTTFTLDVDLASALEKGRRAAGKNRSEFIREAIYEKLLSLGVDVTVKAPDRAKVGFKSKIKLPQEPPKAPAKLSWKTYPIVRPPITFAALPVKPKSQ